MKVKTNIEYSFTAGDDTFHVGDLVRVKSKFLEKYGVITKIGFNDFELSVYGDDELLITFKYDYLIDISFALYPF